MATLLSNCKVGSLIRGKNNNRTYTGIVTKLLPGAVVIESHGTILVINADMISKIIK